MNFFYLVFWLVMGLNMAGCADIQKPKENTQQAPTEQWTEFSVNGHSLRAKLSHVSGKLEIDIKSTWEFEFFKVEKSQPRSAVSEPPRVEPEPPVVDQPAVCDGKGSLDPDLQTLAETFEKEKLAAIFWMPMPDGKSHEGVPVYPYTPFKRLEECKDRLIYRLEQIEPVMLGQWEFQLWFHWQKPLQRKLTHWTVHVLR